MGILAEGGAALRGLGYPAAYAAALGALLDELEDVTEARESVAWVWDALPSHADRAPARELYGPCGEALQLLWGSIVGWLVRQGYGPLTDLVTSEAWIGFADSPLSNRVRDTARRAGVIWTPRGGGPNVLPGPTRPTGPTAGKYLDWWNQRGPLVDVARTYLSGGADVVQWEQAQYPLLEASGAPAQVQRVAGAFDAVPIQAALPRIRALCAQYPDRELREWCTACVTTYLALAATYVADRPLGDADFGRAVLEAAAAAELRVAPRVRPRPAPASPSPAAPRTPGRPAPKPPSFQDRIRARDPSAAAPGWPPAPGASPAPAPPSPGAGEAQGMSPWVVGGLAVGGASLAWLLTRKPAA